MGNNETINDCSHDNVKLLRVADVAFILNISKSLAYRLVQKGLIPSIRFNSVVRIRSADLNSFIQQKRVNMSDSELNSPSCIE